MILNTLFFRQIISARIRQTFGQSLNRNTNKIAVAVAPEFLDQLERNVLKPRNHPGIVKSVTLEVPERIVKALEIAIGDYPLKKLIKDGKVLNQYIRSRHPPPEQLDIRQKIKGIVDEFDKKKTSLDLSNLSEEETEQTEYNRQQKINKILKARTYAWKPLTYGAYESLVYAFGRTTQEYVILLSIMKEISTRDPQFKPRSFFDFGSGVGTGMWAASDLWKSSIFEYYNVDCSKEMNDLSDLILRGGNENECQFLQNVYYRQFLPSAEARYDLVVSAYTLFELPNSKTRKETMLNLWKKCSNYFVIVEEGTRKGSELINEIRDYLLSLEDEIHTGHIFSPCPHVNECPRISNSKDKIPCNFQISYQPMYLGEKNTGRRNVRYSYLVLRKGENPHLDQNWPRILSPPLVRSKHTICRMCTSSGKLQEIVFTQSKHGRLAYRCAKASKWGDRLPIAIGETIENRSK